MANILNIETDTDDVKNLLLRHSSVKEPERKSAENLLSKGDNDTSEALILHKKKPK